MKKLLFGFALPFALFATGALAATFTVTNTNNSGTGSLRNAISSANTNKGSTVAFSTSGTIILSSPLPSILRTTTIDGTTAPGFSGTPTVLVNFNGNSGFVVDQTAPGSAIKSLSLVNSGGAGITLMASKVTVAGNYIGVQPNGTVNGNRGDGIYIRTPSNENLIGNTNPAADIKYFDTANSLDFTVQPVSAWQGIRNSGTTAGEYLICGSSGTSGLLYTGPIDGGGASYLVQFPGSTTIATSVYGPDNLPGGAVRLVGIFRKSNTMAYNYGFVWEGTVGQLPSGGTFRTIDYPGATYQYTHSAMGELAVGNADGPIKIGNVSVPIGAGKAYIYNLTTNTFVANVVYPNSRSNTAYGIWHNGQSKYTICGGHSPVTTDNLQDQSKPLTLGKAFLVDYDAATDTFSNWKSFDYPNGPAGVNFITHFEGISSTEPGVYNLVADSIQAGSTNAAQGSWVTVTRNSNGTFDQGTWVDLNYPATPDSVTSANSVYGNQVVGLVIGPTTFAYQATLEIAFQLSNVISGNGGNGITVAGSRGNVIAMNYIGTDPAGSTNPAYGNRRNGIALARKSVGNLIGGRVAAWNNPTGSKNPANAVFQRPVQGNLISGNLGHGVWLIDESSYNTLSGNYIGTDFTGTSALANQRDGVALDTTNNNTLAGCTTPQNPFVFYNVIAGNAGHGVSVKDSITTTIQGNFLGMGADNATSVPNGGNGLLAAGNSRQVQVGGVIPLGNVIAGNSQNGIEVRDTVKNFISFNSFTGIGAFQEFASPNGGNGVLITSTGGNNTIRTCIVSGNLGNGIEISGKASGVQITDTSVGTNTTISAPIPNQGNGIVIRGKAHKNAIGGFQLSVEPRVFVAGNTKQGIVVMESANNNTIFNTTVGEGAWLGVVMPNGLGGILLDAGSSATTIGGKSAAFHVGIRSNTGSGLLITSSQKNRVIKSHIEDNSLVGVRAIGNCAGTYLKDNTIQNNGAGGTNNLDLAGSVGVVVQP